MNRLSHDDRAKPAPDFWWACKEPERPVDNRVYYDVCCEKCLLKAQADLMVRGDHYITTHDDNGRPKEKVLLSEAIEQFLSDLRKI